MQVQNSKSKPNSSDAPAAAPAAEAAGTVRLLRKKRSIEDTLDVRAELDTLDISANVSFSKSLYNSEEGVTKMIKN